MEMLVQLAKGWFVLATIAPECRTGRWYIRLFDFPRVHLFGLGLVVFAWGLAYPQPESSWFVLSQTMVLGCLVYQAARILPFTPILSAEVPDAAGGGASFAALVANVRYKNRDYQQTLSLIRRYNPDWLVLIEIDEAWDSALQELSQEWPHTVVVPRPEGCGINLYSKLPLTDTEIVYWVSPDRPAIITTITLNSGEAFRVFALHPEPPGLPTAVGEIRDSRPRDAELVIAGKLIAAARLPVVAVGDFNDAAWSHTTRLFRRLSKLLDPRIGRGFLCTFPSWGWLFRIPIDHVFLSSHFAVSSLQVSPPFGSDHLAVYFKVEVNPSTPLQQSDGQATNNAAQTAAADTPIADPAESKAELAEIVAEGREQAERYAEQEKKG